MRISGELASTPTAKSLTWTWRIFIVLMVVWALACLHWGRGIAWDEVEFLKATDWIRQGKVPYRDFFEHHTPLTWFVMAPFESLVRDPGVGPVLWMRWLQVPLWVFALTKVHRWMLEDGDSIPGRLFALFCLIGSPFFVYSALEYRVDTLGTLLVILALDRSRFQERGKDFQLGALLAGAVMANLRFAPLVVGMALLIPAVDLKGERWRFQVMRLGWISFGAALVCLPWLLYLLFTHSVGDMWHWCIWANRVSASSVGAYGSIWEYFIYPALGQDLPSVALEVGMLVGAGVVITGIRRPKFIHLLLMAQAVNLAFVAFMKVKFFYHFELSLCLAAPFLSLCISSLMARSSRAWPGVATAFMVMALAVNGYTLARDNDHPTLVYQDRVLKQAAALAPPGSTVLDACGWLLEAKPAYRFWFLPSLVNVLQTKHLVTPYSEQDLERDPPRLVIANLRLEESLGLSQGLYDSVVSHYLPISANLWVPGLNRALSDVAPTWTWTVHWDGDYQVLAGKELGKHPWFHDPFAFTAPIPSPSRAFVVDPSEDMATRTPEIRWSLDGTQVQPEAGVIRLQRGQRLEATYNGKGVIGVMLVPRGTGELFLPPPKDLTLDYISFNTYRPGS